MMMKRSFFLCLPFSFCLFHEFLIFLFFFSLSLSFFLSCFPPSFLLFRVRRRRSALAVTKGEETAAGLKRAWFGSTAPLVCLLLLIKTTLRLMHALDFSFVRRPTGALDSRIFSGSAYAAFHLTMRQRRPLLVGLRRFEFYRVICRELLARNGTLPGVSFVGLPVGFHVGLGSW